MVLQGSYQLLSFVCDVNALCESLFQMYYLQICTNSPIYVRDVVFQSRQLNENSLNENYFSANLKPIILGTRLDKCSSIFLYDVTASRFTVCAQYFQWVINKQLLSIRREDVFPPEREHLKIEHFTVRIHFLSCCEPPQATNNFLLFSCYFCI